MRSAEARVAAITSLNSAVQGAGHTWEMLRVPRQVARWGLVAGGGVLGIILMRRILSFGRRRENLPALPAPKPQSIGISIAQMAVQALPILLAPWVKSQFSGGRVGHFFSRFSIDHLIARWLGFDK